MTYPEKAEAMESTTSLDTRLITQLREMAAADRSVCAMLRSLLEQLPFDKSKGRIKTIAYIQKAFYLSLADAAAVGAWHVFPDGSWPDEDCEQFLRPRIHATRSQWMNQQP